MGCWCSYCCSASKNLCDDENCIKCFNNSYASQPRAIYWSSKNKVTPRDVKVSSGKKYIFECDDCFHEYKSSLSSTCWCPYCSNTLCEDDDCKACFNRSFASHEKVKYWSAKNIKNPRDLCKGSAERAWFNCDECKHEFETSLLIVNGGSWCPYCHGCDICSDLNCISCYNKSFASSERAISWSPMNNITPRMISKGTADKYWFNCDNCTHSFNKALNTIPETWCPYCANKKLCSNNCIDCYNKSFASTEKSKYIINNIPRNLFKYSDKRSDFKCNVCDNIFNSQIKNISRGQWCPVCKLKTEKILYEYLKCLYDTVYQFKDEWCINPVTNRHLKYDFLVNNKIIIELDGLQHFKQVMNWASPEETRKRDLLKMKLLYDNGYSLIRLLQEDYFITNMIGKRS